jgi:NAD(P)-dependent dehydrogenase (short-subunit alcohol dehydrogenase family)
MTVTIINGGSQGLGEAVARTLSERGATGLVLVGRSADRGTALATELTASGTESIFIEADAEDPDVPERVVAACDDRFGVVHGVVNVAAYTYRSTIFSETIDEWDRMMAINVRAPFFLIQAAARLMIQRRVAGSIVNVGSVAGFGGPTKLASYTISKGALNVMTKHLAFALMNHRIRVNQVNPGWMDTESEDRTQRLYDGADDNWLEIAEAGRPWKRLVKPWEVANAIAFCLSEESGLMTGNLIDIDQSVRGAGDQAIPTWDETPQPDLES